MKHERGTMERQLLPEEGQTRPVARGERENVPDNPLEQGPAVHRWRAVDRFLAQAHSAFSANQFEHALRNYEEAVARGADIDSCAHERWSCWMKLGRYELAWRETDRTD